MECQKWRNKLYELKCSIFNCNLNNLMFPVPGRDARTNYAQLMTQNNKLTCIICNLFVSLATIAINWNIYQQHSLRAKRIFAVSI